MSGFTLRPPAPKPVLAPPGQPTCGARIRDGVTKDKGTCARLLRHEGGHLSENGIYQPRNES